MASITGDRAWARRLAERVEAGEFVGHLAVEMASEVLDRPILRGGKHAVRPDTKDLQAGDYHDDDRVAI